MWKVSIKHEKKVVPKLPKFIKEIFAELVSEL